MINLVSFIIGWLVDCLL